MRSIAVTLLLLIAASSLQAMGLLSPALSTKDYDQTIQLQNVKTTTVSVSLWNSRTDANEMVEDLKVYALDQGRWVLVVQASRQTSFGAGIETAGNTVLVEFTNRGKKYSKEYRMTKHPYQRLYY